MMQFVTLRQAQEGPGGTVTVKQHWYLTEDRTRVVEEGHPDSRWLWASPGTEVRLAEAIRLGAVKVEEPMQEPETGEEKESAKDADPEPAKAQKPAANKAAKQAPNKAAAKGEDK